MPQQLGIHNEQLVQARRLLTSKGRKERQRFLFEGPTLLKEALSSSMSIVATYISESAWHTESQLRELPLENVFIVSDKAIAGLSDVRTPTGIICEARLPTHSPQAILDLKGPLVLFSGLNDPGNVGTLLRSAEAFGMAGVLVLEGTADLYQPKVIRAAMGSLFRLPVALVSIAMLQEGVVRRPLIGLERGGIPLPRHRFHEQSIITIGHERQGLSTQLPPLSDRIEIPHQGPTESLNAAIAGSIVFFAISCQMFMSRPWLTEGQHDMVSEHSGGNEGSIALF